MRKSESRSNGWRWVKQAVAVLVSAVVLAGAMSVALVPVRAEASTLGVGVGITIPFSGGAELWFGTHNTSPGGTATYCTEFNIYPTTGWGQSYAGLQGSGLVVRSADTNQSVVHTKTLSAADMTALNYVVSTWGDTSNANQAASVAYAVWTITTHPTVWSYQVGRSWFASGTAAFSGNGDYMAAQGRAYAASAGGSGSGSAAISFDVDDTNHYVGTLDLNVLSPSPASGVITLTNGYFVSTGTSSITSSAFTQGQSLEVRGVPPVDGSPYKISASGAFDAGYAANVALYTTGSRQYLIRAGGRTTMSATANDPFDRSVGFQPILTSQVAERYIKSGDPLIDSVSFAIQADQNGVINEWAKTLGGSYVGILAKGTVYGPFATPPAQSAAVPVGAPVAGTATVTTTSADGPTVTYTATADNAATGAGYYVWVWEIDYDDQGVFSQLYLPQPDPANGLSGYYWSDEFGIHAETAIVTPEVSTVATETGIAGYAITDIATVTGAVFADAEIGFEAFLQTDAIATCTAATLAFTSTRQPVPAAGEYTSEDFTPVLAGTYFWIETLYDASGNIAHQGECGELLETSVVDQFLMTTAATHLAAPGDMVSDKATIRGVLQTDSTLIFSAYYSSTATPKCEPSNLVYTTPTVIDIPAGFIDAATFASAPFNTGTITDGYLFWVETLLDNTDTVIGEGVCGAAGETTQLKTLADTGGNPEILGAGLNAGGLALLVGAALFIGVTVRRRKMATT